jgi:PAS domain S-box-containing protein
MSQKQKDIQGSELFRWYLAFLRSDAKLRAERMSMTPLTLVERDKNRIQEMIQKSGSARVERSLQVLVELRKKHGSNANILKLVPGGSTSARMLDEQIVALSKLIAVLDEPTDTEMSIDKLTDKVISELEHARQGEKLIADYTSDLLCCLDEKRLVMEINLEFELVTGYQKLSIAAVPIDKIIMETDRDGFIEFLNTRRERADDQLHECAVRCKDGTTIDLQWQVEWSQTAQCYFCRAKNITERKARQKLREEVARMARHDLRTPLTGLGLVMDNVQLGIYGHLSDAGMEQITQARATIDRMVEMIDNLINANKSND